MLGGKGAGPSRLTGWISIIGLTIGCMAMILSISILNGFESRVINKIIGFEGDIKVTNVSNWNNLDSKLLKQIKSAYELEKNPLTFSRIYGSDTVSYTHLTLPTKRIV